MPRISGLYIALHAALQLALALRVMLLRSRHAVMFGDGGEKPLSRAIRAHGNAAEYVPITLLLLLVCELNGGSALLLHACGGGLLVSRLLHAAGIMGGRIMPWGRLLGISGTVLVIGSLVVANLLLLT
jgi:uncharacterized membrane protein YecN with MAPEG domain